MHTFTMHAFAMHTVIRSRMLTIRMVRQLQKASLKHEITSAL